eukprot:5188448-Prymnesium_polylepis.1
MPITPEAPASEVPRETARRSQSSPRTRRVLSIALSVTHLPTDLVAPSSQVPPSESSDGRSPSRSSSSGPP